MLPPELLLEIFSYIEPWLTREDWRTCKQAESQQIHNTIQILAGSRPRNAFVPMPYSSWSFYDRLRFGKEHYLQSPWFSNSWAYFFRKRKSLNQ